MQHYPLVMKDTLHNCSQRNIRHGDDVTYGRGIIMGAVAGVMAVTGNSWQQAYDFVMAHAPKDLDKACIPEAWR